MKLNAETKRMIDKLGGTNIDMVLMVAKNAKFVLNTGTIKSIRSTGMFTNQRGENIVNTTTRMVITPNNRPNLSLSGVYGFGS